MPSKVNGSHTDRARQSLLVIAAAAILLCVILTPRVAVDRGTVLRAFPDDPDIAAVIDVRTVGTYILGIVATTTLLWFAIGLKRRRRDFDVLQERIDSLEVKLDQV